MHLKGEGWDPLQIRLVNSEFRGVRSIIMQLRIDREVLRMNSCAIFARKEDILPKIASMGYRERVE